MGGGKHLGGGVSDAFIWESFEGYPKGHRIYHSIYRATGPRYEFFQNFGDEIALV